MPNLNMVKACVEWYEWYCGISLLLLVVNQLLQRSSSFNTRCQDSNLLSVFTYRVTWMLDEPRAPPTPTPGSHIQDSIVLVRLDWFGMDTIP
eukprot:g47855.t1